jgi:hypothetical protein
MSAGKALEFMLGGFAFAKSLTFTVFGDHPNDPVMVEVVLDDGVQEPYGILTIDGVGRVAPEPESTWLDGWIAYDDPWARIIYGNTIGVVRQARSAQRSQGLRSAG